VKDPDFGTLEGTYDLWFKLALKLTTIRNFLPMFSLTHVVPVLDQQAQQKLEGILWKLVYRTY
jgi:hypothetical protein